MQIATPSQVWTGEACQKPGIIDLGSLVQLMVKIPGHCGFNSVFVRIDERTTSGYLGTVLDGPSELKNKHLAFSAGNVFHVL